MSVGRAIQMGVVSTMYGIVAGAAVDALLPSYVDGVGLQQLLLETAVQVGATGALIAFSQSYLGSNDPTHGILFGSALMQAQPNLTHRLSALGSIAGTQVSANVQQMASLAPAASTSN